MVVVGGAVAACLLPVPEEFAGSIAGLQDYYHDVAYTSSDIDVYLYELNGTQFADKVPHPPPNFSQAL